MSSEKKRLANAGLSDLFFNYAHPNYDKLRAAGYPAQDSAVIAALQRDAEDFISTLGVALNDLGFAPPLPSAEQFADDFLARL